VALVVVNLFVIPAFAKVFAGFGAELPLMTAGTARLFRLHGGLLAIPAGMASSLRLAFLLAGNKQRGRYDWDRMSLKFPIAGKILHKAALSRFARSFSLGMRSGVPVMQALSNSAQTVDNHYVSRCIEGMRENVERGESLLRASISSGILHPRRAADGRRGRRVGRCRRHDGRDRRHVPAGSRIRTQNAGQQIEPILIVMLGIMVLILALGIFLPMWDLGKVAIKR
jgi:MSHA biogenesis protein MshG